MKHKIIVVGGGASGLMAAITAKDLGTDVAIVEGTDRIAKKILITGNGRCNISNRYPEHHRYHSDNEEFFTPSLKALSIKSTEEFFYSLGLPLTSLEEGKMYPMSLQASSVVDIFRFALFDRDIQVYYNSKVKSIKAANSGFRLLLDNEEVLECEKLILCCGGKSAASTGSDGSGFQLAKSIGHNIVKPIPALVQLKLDYRNLKALSGIKFNGVAEVYVNSSLIRREFGEILFTDYGISGPPVLQLSRIASYAMARGKIVHINVDMMYSKTKEELEDFLETHWAIFSHRSVFDSFIGVIHKKIIPILLKEAGITDIHKSCYDLTWKEKSGIYALLKSWRFLVTETNGFSNSQVTAGGVNTTEVNPETLESRLIENLYFAGEILDVDGDCGGFNLQWAWCSGFVAGKSASSK